MTAVKCRSNYHEREILGLNDESRGPVKEIVGDYLFTHVQSKNIVLFDLPSAHWYFEDFVLSKYTGRTFKFIGVERMSYIYKLGVNYMPGDAYRNYKLNLHNRSVKVSETNQSVFLKMELINFMKWCKKDTTGRLFRKFGNWNCCWFDFCGALSCGYLNCMAHIEWFLDKRLGCVPSAFTFSIGHETKGVKKSCSVSHWGSGNPILRSTLIKEELNKHLVDYIWHQDGKYEYTSSVQKMCVIYGRFLKKKKEAEENVLLCAA